MTFTAIPLTTLANVTYFMPGSWTPHRCHLWCRKRYQGLYALSLAGNSIMVVIG